MRKILVLVLALLLFLFSYLFIRKQSVSIIDVHYDGNTAQVIVDKLPFMESNKIAWWNKNEIKIMKKYSIPSGGDGPFLITVYAFGKGYQEEGKEDRRCFSDMKPPKNCIDKTILMSISRTRNGSIKYDF